MKYKLFPRVDFLAHIKKIHVSYHPGREKAEVARRLIMHMTSEPTKKKFPKLETSWEILGYDAPSTIDITFPDDRKRRFNADHFSRGEMSNIIDEWKFSAHLTHMKEHNLEKPGEEE